MRPVAVLLAVLALASPAAAAETRFMLGLDITGDAQRKLIRYDCGDAPGESFEVEYINAAPNFLAFVPVEGETYLFTLTLSGSGARYAAARYIWWNDGPEASLYDVTLGENADPILTCTEHIQTP